MLHRSFSSLRVGLIMLALAFAAPMAVAQVGPGGMGGPSKTLSSDDVSEEEMDAAAEIIVALQMQRQEMRRQMMQKYDNPQEMDSTQRRKARMEIRQKRQALMQEKTKEEDLSPQRLGLIMKSARQDSTLRRRIQTAVQKKQNARMTEGNRSGATQDEDAGDDSSDDGSGDGETGSGGTR